MTDTPDNAGAAGEKETVVRCYLCGQTCPRDETEVARHRVPSGKRGGTVHGVHRYVRMCRLGFGCRDETAWAHVAEASASGNTGSS